MRHDFDDRLRASLARALEEAVRRSQDSVTPLHLLLGLLRAGGAEVGDVLGTWGVDREKLTGTVERVLPRPRGGGEVTASTLPYHADAKAVLGEAVRIGRRTRADILGPRHLLEALRVREGTVRRVLREFEGGRPDSEAGSVSAPASPGAASPEVPWFLAVDPAEETSVYEQIVARVAEAVATGDLAPGERLPAIRELADELDLAPGTVARAYSVLEERGVLRARGARGTRVAEAPTPLTDPELSVTLEGLLRPVVVAAYHLATSPQELRAALDRAMEGVLTHLDDPEPPRDP